MPPCVLHRDALCEALDGLSPARVQTVTLDGPGGVPGYRGRGRIRGRARVRARVGVRARVRALA